MKNPHLRLTLLLLIFGLGFPPALRAQLGITGKLATTGPGFDVTSGITDILNFRIGYNRLGLISGYDFDDNLKLDLQFESIPILLDWHVLDGNFRLTGGLYYNRNRGTLSARARDIVEVNNTNYRIDAYSINVDFDDFSPYLGFGWGLAIDPAHRLSFAFDFGILFQGEPSVTGRAVASASEQQNQLDRDFDAELASRSSDFSDLKLYPVISIGLSYRF